MTTREKIILEAEDRASREFDQATGGFERMDRTMRRAAVAGGIAIAGAAIARVGGAVLGMAIDAREAESAFATAFGEALPQASQFVDEFAIKAGFARHELQQMLAVTGSVVQGIGATEAESAALAQSMAVLAGDVASFSNATGGAEAVMMALQSAINGEREALKTYGLALSEAEVQERALQDTQKTRAEDLTRLEKAQATVTLAYEKAGKAAGDLDRTQDSAANTLRRLQAMAKEAGTEVGETLLDSLDDLLPVLEAALPLAAGLAQAFAGGVTSGFGKAAIAAGVLYGALTLISKHPIIAGITILTTGIGALNDKMAESKQTVEDTNVAFDKLGEHGKRRALEGFFTDEQITKMDNFGLSIDDVVNGTIDLDHYFRVAGYSISEMTAFMDEAGRSRFQTIAGEAQQLATIAGYTAEAIEEIPPEAEAAEKAILDMAEAAHEGAAALREDLAKEAKEFITGFEELPDRVETTMDEFETNMTDRITAQQEFWAGLRTLAEAGFGDIAEAIRQEGPTAQGLLDELTGDMTEAARLDEIAANARTDMEDLTDGYATALEDFGDPVLTAMGTYGEQMIAAIAEGIENGDLVGPLRRKLEEAQWAVTGTNPADRPSTRTRRNAPGGVGHAFAEGTWEVPGTGPIGAIVHGRETIFGPPGTSGRAAMVRDLATELGKVIGQGGGGKTVTVDQITITVPAGTTITEAIGEAGAAAAIEAFLS